MNDLTIKDNNKTPKKNHLPNGKFAPGNNANPKGRNGYLTVKEIQVALDDESVKRGYKDFAQYVAKRALVNDTVMIALLKKIIPDLVKVEGDIPNIGIFIHNIINKANDGQRQSSNSSSNESQEKPGRLSAHILN